MKKGFTLIELLAVVAIIAILASVVIVQTGAARQRSRESKQKADLKTVQSALEVYYEANGRYPVPTGNCAIFGDHFVCGEMNAYGTERDYSGANGWVPDLAPTYLAVLPSNPLRLRPAAYSVQQGGANCVPNTTGYAYFVNSTGTDYKLNAHCSVERAIEVNDPFREPCLPLCGRTWAYAIYTPGAVSW